MTFNERENQWIANILYKKTTRIEEPNYKELFEIQTCIKEKDKMIPWLFKLRSSSKRINDWKNYDSLIPEFKQKIIQFQKWKLEMSKWKIFVKSNYQSLPN